MDTRYIDARFDQIWERLLRLELEVANLNDDAATEPSSRAVVRPEPPAPAPAPVVVAEPDPAPELDPGSAWPIDRVPQPTYRERAHRPRREIDFSALVGPRAFAWAGGVVTLLGILFFFVLAVNRGWIGPELRVALGGITSGAAFGAGLWLRRRFGDSHAALGAVGAGISGAFGTLLAASALYGLLPSGASLGLATLVALAGVATALRWKSELVAGIGLIGAALVPLSLGIQDGLTLLGAGFAGIVFAGTIAVAVVHRWRALLVLGTVIVWPQIALEVSQHGGAPLGDVLIAGAGSLATVVAGIAWSLRTEAPALRRTSTGLIGAGVSLAVGSAFHLYAAAQSVGFALLVVAVVLSALAAALFRRRRGSDLSAFLGAGALTVGALSLGELLSGAPLAYAWAAEAAALAWLARRVREPRYQVWSLGYLGLALGHVLVIDAPPSGLFAAGGHPARGLLAVVAVAVAALVFAGRAYDWSTRLEPAAGLFARLAGFLRSFQDHQRALWLGSLWAAAALGLYSSALGILQLFVSSGAGSEWGHVAVDAVWALVALAVILLGLRRDSTQLLVGGYVWLGLTLALVVGFDLKHLAATPRDVAMIVVAAPFLTAGVAHALRRGLVELSGGPIAISLALSVAGVVQLASSDRLEGLGLLLLSGVYGGVSTRLFRKDRDLSTLLCGIALALAAAGSARVVGGTYLVLVWAAGAATLTWAASRLGERRLQVAALAYLVLALGHALVVEAPPTQLFTAQPDPASGVPALMLALAAIAVFGRYERRVATWWTAGVVALYTLSLSILELVQKVSPGSVDANFQRGHSAVSACWGVTGLVLLYVGLTRRPALRVAGFALFGISLAKLFLYDLPSLSSITRALSFLAVGALLLAAGFFYQRLLTRTR